jgi:hypothetical protein
MQLQERVRAIRAEELQLDGEARVQPGERDSKGDP